MYVEQTACEDLKAFERRLTEITACVRPATIKWRIILFLISVSTAIGAWHWLKDSNLSAVSLTQSLLDHPFFTVSTLILCSLFLFGIHEKVIAPSIIIGRTRIVLKDFNMSCDDTGKLILKPRPFLT